MKKTKREIYHHAVSRRPSHKSPGEVIEETALRQIQVNAGQPDGGEPWIEFFIKESWETDKKRTWSRECGITLEGEERTKFIAAVAKLQTQYSLDSLSVVEEIAKHAIRELHLRPPTDNALTHARRGMIATELRTMRDCAIVARDLAQQGD